MGGGESICFVLFFSDMFLSFFSSFFFLVVSDFTPPQNILKPGDDDVISKEALQPLRLFRRATSQKTSWQVAFTESFTLHPERSLPAATFDPKNFTDHPALGA